MGGYDASGKAAPLSEAEAGARLRSIFVDVLATIAQTGDRQAVGDYLRLHPQYSIDTRDTHGRTALMFSALRQHALAAETLAGYGAGLDLATPEGITALIYAAGLGAEDVALVLLRHGADRDWQSGPGLNAADIARHGGHERLARVIEGYEAAVRH